MRESATVITDARRERGPIPGASSRRRPHERRHETTAARARRPWSILTIAASLSLALLVSATVPVSDAAADAVTAAPRAADTTPDDPGAVCRTGSQPVPPPAVALGPSLSYPMWSDAVGWDDPTKYGTIQLADVDGDPHHDLELLARGVNGIEMHDFDTSSGQWMPPRNSSGQLVPPVMIQLSDEKGWNAPSQSETIQTADIDGDGNAELLARAGRDPRLGLRRTYRGLGRARATSRRIGRLLERAQLLRDDPDRRHRR